MAVRLRNQPRRSSGTWEISCPSKSTRPPVGCKSRSETRPTVVLPEPDSPTKANVSARATVRLTPDTAVTSPPRKSPLRVRKTIETSSSAKSGPGSGMRVGGTRSVSVKGSFREELDLVALAGDDRIIQPAAGMAPVGYRNGGRVGETRLPGVGTARVKAASHRERGEIGRIAGHRARWDI